MNIKLEQDRNQKDMEVLIRYAPHMDSTVRRLEDYLRTYDRTLKCSADHREVWLHAADIYYAESVDKHTFVYGEKEVYRSELRLYQLLEELADAGFVQVSKSCVLNIRVLESIRPLINSRMEAVLTNGERINVTRKYVSVIKEKLQER